jgi:hypothetical protein
MFSVLPLGGAMEVVTTYTVFEGSQTDPDAEARRILSPPNP